jgi:hypothetical protein
VLGDGPGWLAGCPYAYRPPPTTTTRRDPPPTSPLSYSPTQNPPSSLSHQNPPVLCVRTSLSAHSQNARYVEIPSHTVASGRHSSARVDWVVYAASTTNRSLSLSLLALSNGLSTRASSLCHQQLLLTFGDPHQSNSADGPSAPSRSTIYLTFTLRTQKHPQVCLLVCFPSFSSSRSRSRRRDRFCDRPHRTQAPSPPPPNATQAALLHHHSTILPHHPPQSSSSLPHPQLSFATCLRPAADLGCLSDPPPPSPCLRRRPPSAPPRAAAPRRRRRVGLLAPLVLARRLTPFPDPNAPKRGLSAYMFFANEQRENVHKENPGISFGKWSRAQMEMPPTATVLTRCVRPGRQGPRREVEGPEREAAQPLRGQGRAGQEALRGREGQLQCKSRAPSRLCDTTLTRSCRLLLKMRSLPRALALSHSSTARPRPG